MAEHPTVTTILEGEQFDAMSTVVGQVAHDFNNLLTPLLAYPPLIKSDLPEGAYGAGLLDVVEKTSKDMVHITRQLLELTTKRKFEQRPLDINLVVEKVIQEIRNTALPEGLAIQFDPGKDLVRVNGSADRLATAIHNICANGLEAMGSGGRLGVETRGVCEESRVTRCGHRLESGDYVKISVRDSGAGIPPEIVDRVFEPFATTKKAAGRRGAGLGLSVAYRILRDHAGCIDFESVSGAGTEFSLYLPVGARREVGGESAAMPAASLSARPVEIVPCDKGRILIADDEKTILRLFQMILSSGLPDRAIDLANNGQEAVTAFATGHHALLLMDLHMPVMDGQAAFVEIQKLCQAKNWAMPSVVFCTGFAPPDTVRNVVTANPIHGLLSKPVSGEVLIETVKSRLA